MVTPMPDPTDALLAHPAHHTNRYALAGARLHHRRAGWVAVEEPEQAQSWFGHRLVLPRSPFAEGLDVWMARWRSEARAATPRRAYLCWATDVRDAGAEREAAAAGLELHTLRLRRITARPVALGRRPPPGPPGAVYRPLSGPLEWAAALALQGQAFGGGVSEQQAFARWALSSRRARVDVGEGVEWGAFVDGRLVGHCGLMFDPADRRRARFQDVATDPRWAGRKIAGNLLAAALDRFFAAGAVEAWILADAEARPDRIYAALGFEPVSWVYELGVPPDG